MERDVITKLIPPITQLPKPALVGISGFGGAGKSTVAREIKEHISCAVIGVDGFFKTKFAQSLTGSTAENVAKHRHRIQGATAISHEWIDFERLRSQVLLPFLQGQTSISYQGLNWETGYIDREETLTITDSAILVVEGVSLFRPGINELCALKVWIDCPLEVAKSRGKRRDKLEYGVDNDTLWDGIWEQSDRDYYQNYEPHRVADLLIAN